MYENTRTSIQQTVIHLYRSCYLLLSTVLELFFKTYNYVKFIMNNMFEPLHKFYCMTKNWRQQKHYQLFVLL